MGMVTAGTLILFSASFLFWRLSGRKLTMLLPGGYSVPLSGLIPQIFHYVLIEVLRMVWAGEGQRRWERCDKKVCE